jgi:ribose-phosphate pyrophosphokinase
MELLFYIDAFRRASAHEITAVVPYYPTGARSAWPAGAKPSALKVVANMLQMLGVARVVYFDVHAAATQAFFDVPVDPLSALTVPGRLLQEAGVCRRPSSSRPM